ncbi:replication initiation protein RepM [Acinetobacter baumannii]|uniref:replication initiation protein RepM n=1 Tax=Acinetobacter baumannii TaxID=470 RepID=UPI0023421F60|nr:replication initiation protein RepM [Acinetobacter baumannii]MDC4797847.1 replication initiation protein RepM [Acinetobacter baumannii]MDK2104775.1 replication initiation protein RepM [Acinetobacter baumannii]MDK2150496.1 replication initiation protein RepM [Acinetobacter baumannii]MDK2180144.1 replication initiation protein RepM [Acinetobacter baumannii]MDK2198453.1 replication initiation protein RepM [Acinetobacter baumannii]
MAELIVKDNALIQASYTLDTVEQRLILLAIAEARETGQGITENSLLEVHASSYINTFNVEKHTAYTVLRDASRSLFDRYVTYHDINPKTGKDRSFHCRWVDKIGYEHQSGVVFLRFTQDIVPLITRLEENFTKYEIQQVSKLTSTYAIRLYELLIQWRSSGQTPIFNLSTFRQQLGVEVTQYKTMSNFKTYVLDFALKQVNELTDITANYQQHKTGRTISGFSFTFKQKQERKKVRTKKTNLTEKQLDLFANKLAYNPAFSSQFSEIGESYENFVKRIKQQLKDPVNLDKYLGYLDNLDLKA